KPRVAIDLNRHDCLGDVYDVVAFAGVDPLDQLIGVSHVDRIRATTCLKLHIFNFRKGLNGKSFAGQHGIGERIIQIFSSKIIVEVNGIVTITSFVVQCRLDGCEIAKSETNTEIVLTVVADDVEVDSRRETVYFDFVVALLSIESQIGQVRV